MPDGKTRILVIDDDADLTTTVRVALEAEGYDVDVANSGRTGLELAHTRQPHLILLDALMPDIDGYQVCRELQFGYTKDIPVVFLTARRDLSAMKAASQSGASGYITKPFRTQDLLESVRDLLRDALAFRDDVTGLPTLSRVQVEVLRRLFGYSQLGILYVTLDGVWALEQTQGFEVVDEVFRVVGRRLNQSRGTLLRDEDFVSVSSLGNAFWSSSRHRVTAGPSSMTASSRSNVASSSSSSRISRTSWRASSSPALYVGHAKLALSPKVRFRRALLEAIDAAMRTIEAERSEAQHRLRGEFERVLLERQITCVYQPIVELDAFTVIGYELLARGPAGTELHRPDALFEVARHQGRVADLDRVCRMVATRGSGTLPAKYLRFINTEPTSLFFHSRSQDYIREFIDATPPALRSRTVIEITENAIIEDFEHVRGVLRRVRGEGFLIAIDDAGAGHSGLQTMVEVESDFIKLDMSLTRSIEQSVVKQRLVRTLREFCTAAEIQLVAEGAETRAQLDVLIELGVRHAQGFLFALPGSPFPLRETIIPGEGRPCLPPSILN